ncbi:MAG: hypothetical protein ACPLSM_03865 [Thermosphaera sp.]
MEEKVLPVKVNSINDLVRLAVSTVTPQALTYIIRFRLKDKIVIGILGVFRDYYKYYGLPLFYYYIVNPAEQPMLSEANYVVVSTSEERFEFAKQPKPGVSIPIIGLSEKPPFIPDLE